MAHVDVRRAYFFAPSRRRVFVELPPEDYQASDEHMCGLLRYSLYGTRHATQNWEEEFASTLSELKSDERDRVVKVASKVNMSWQPCTGDDITIGGELSAVECLLKMTSRTYEIKKQVIGEDADLEQSGKS